MPFVTRDDWESRLTREALSSGHETPWNAFRPHPKFRYPPFAPIDGTPSEYLNLFQRLAFPENPQSVRLFSTPQRAVRTWIKNHSLNQRRIAVFYPCPSDILEVIDATSCSRVPLSRDPENWNFSETTLPFDALIWSHPSRSDGLFYPIDIVQDAHRALRAHHPHLPVLIDESAALFSLNATPPGQWPHTDPALTVFHCLHPVWTPQGPPLTWCASAAPAKAGPELVEAENLQEALAALLTFRSQQGSAFGEFQRKILLVQKGLRHWGDTIKPLLEKKYLRVPLWPESGFFLCCEVAQEILERLSPEENHTPLEQYCVQLARDTGLLVVPGTLIGLPQSFQICFAALPKDLEVLGKKLLATFQKISGQDL